MVFVLVVEKLDFRPSSFSGFAGPLSEDRRLRQIRGGGLFLWRMTGFSWKEDRAGFYFRFSGSSGHSQGQAVIKSSLIRATDLY
jgi:hypothetical protein